jgi:spore maturation protein CgeB
MMVAASKKLVVFGLTVSSSWGNGHATLWRGLISALARRGWRTVFFERDVPYYAENRDLHVLPEGALVLYDDEAELGRRARIELADADVAMVTSFCPDGLLATDLVATAPRPIRIFYDLDTPVTLAGLGSASTAAFIGPRGLADFDLVLSFTGGAALDGLRTRLRAKRVFPLYGHVDPDLHRPAAPRPEFAADLSYLGTYADDRQAQLEILMLEPARRAPGGRFVIAGAQYPREFPWGENIFFVRHLPPVDHPAFYASSRLTLNVTRRPMAAMGWCPSGRLFEAASCGAAILTDRWPGLEDFFEPGKEIFPAGTSDEAMALLDLPDEELSRIGMRARDRVLADHTSARRAAELETILSHGLATRPPSHGAASQSMEPAAVPDGEG